MLIFFINNLKLNSIIDISFETNVSFLIHQLSKTKTMNTTNLKLFHKIHIFPLFIL